MRIQRAKELLGQDVKDLTDQEISEIIQRDSAFMEVMLELLTISTLGGDNENSD